MKIFLAALAAMTGLAGCDRIQNTFQPSVREQESAKAHAAADSVSFTAGNAERENVLKRSEMVANPGLVGYVVLFQFDQPIAYYTIKGKITSGNKRLETPVKEYKVEGDSGLQQGTLGDAPSYDGTYGSSDSYVYFWTSTGQYIQWSGDYLYSDKPFVLNKNAAVTIAN